MTRSGRTSRASSRSSRSTALASTPIETASSRGLRRERAVDRAIEVRLASRPGSASCSRFSMRSGSTSATSATAPFIVAASGCAPPMPPRPAVTTSRPARSPPKSARRGGEGLEGALHDALASDVDPGARRHLAVHRQPEALEPAKLVARRPGGNEHRVGDEDPRRVFVRLEDADGLARLDEHRLVARAGASASRRSSRSTPSCARPARCRRRRSALRASRRRPDRGCSRASGARPPAPSPGSAARCPARARIVREAGRTRRAHGADYMSGARRRPSTAGEATALHAPRSRGRAARSRGPVRAPGRGSRPGPCGGSAPRTRSIGADEPSGRRNSIAWNAVISSIASTRSRFSTIAASLRAAIGDIETWSSLAAEVGIESTEAGCARTLHSETRPAAVTCAIMRPEWSPPSRTRNAGRSESAGLTSFSMRRSEIEARSAAAIAA